MALDDHYGNALTTSSSDARDHYDRGVAMFLAAQPESVAQFRQAIEVDDGFALGHAAQARAAMMDGDMAQAKASIARAQDLASTTSAREQRHIAAFEKLMSGNAPAARETVLEHVQEHPRDAMVAQLCTSVFGLIGFSGKVGREADLLAFTSALLPHYGQDWWMMSMHAISLCETGQTQASLDLMGRALAQNPRNANGAHFKAHAQYEIGETRAGRAYLSDWLVDYETSGVMHGHLSWHVALWALHEGDEAGMWQAIDAHIGPDGSQGLPINVVTDTAAILYRAELAGFDVDPKRWSRLSDYAAKVFPEPGQSFADMHTALSHAMAGEGERLAILADTSKGFAADLVRPVAKAWGAIARQEWQSALECLTDVLHTNERFGGSRAQRDLLELSYANVLLKLGRTDEARRSLTTRRPVLSDTPALVFS